MLLDSKDSRTFIMKDSFRAKAVDRTAWLKRRVQLNERIRPQETVLDLAVDLLRDAGVGNLDEAFCVRRVFGDDVLMESEYVHSKCSLPGRPTIAPAVSTPSRDFSGERLTAIHRSQKSNQRDHVSFSSQSSPRFILIILNIAHVFLGLHATKQYLNLTRR